MKNLENHMMILFCGQSKFPIKFLHILAFILKNQHDYNYKLTKKKKITLSNWKLISKGNFQSPMVIFFWVTLRVKERGQFPQIATLLQNIRTVWEQNKLFKGHIKINKRGVQISSGGSQKIRKINRRPTF